MGFQKNLALKMLDMENCKKKKEKREKKTKRNKNEQTNKQKYGFGHLRKSKLHI